MSAESTSASIARRLFDAYNRRDLDVVATLYAADGTHEDVAHGKPKSGGREIADGLGRFLGWFPDASWDLLSIVADDRGSVAARYVLSGTLGSSMGPITPRGQKISLRGMQSLTIEEGKIARSEDYWDAATFQKQLNVKNPEE